MNIIKVDTYEEGFVMGGQQLLDTGKEGIMHLVLIVANPTNFDSLDRCLSVRNSWRIDRKHENVRNVINTIFPYGLASFYNGRRNEFYKKYLDIYSKSKKKRWGTYFQRFICFGKDTSTNNPNQLENIIESLNSNIKVKNNCIMHTTSVALGKNTAPRGAPCLQYVQFSKSDNNSLNLYALYRNQDYFSKGLGNILGLAKLLEFVCNETPYDPGTLTMHAVHAYISDSRRVFTTIVN